MAAKWERKLTSTEIGFEVISVEKAMKAGYVVTTVKYPTIDHNYTYVRKATVNNFEGCTVVDGCEVRYSTIDYTVKSVERIYDTKGLKKQVNPGGASKSTVEKIKNELESKDIQVKTQNRKLKYSQEKYITKNMKQLKSAY